MKILIACEYSGRVRREFEKLGHEVLSCDFEPAEDGAKNHYQGDVTDGVTTNAIAKVVGVSRPTISRLLSGKTWGGKS